MRAVRQGSSRTRGRARGALLALVLGCIAALAGMEIVSRLARLDSDELRITFDPGTEAWARFDSRMGWVNLPGLLGNNRQGFRFPRDYAPRAQGPGRIALLGDSQVWGMGVGEDEHLGVLLDGKLGGAEVYSFGVPGYGPVQQLLLLEELLQDFDVGHLLAVAFVYNDLAEESVSIAYGGFQKPYLQRTADGWRRVEGPLPRPVLGADAETMPFFGRAPELRFLQARGALAEHSALYRALLQRASRRPALAGALEAVGLAMPLRERATSSDFYAIRRIDGRTIPCWHLEMCPEDHRLDGLDAVLAAYERMEALCDAHEVDFRVVLTPSYPELAEGRFDVIDALAEGLAKRGIATVDVREAFRSQEDWRTVAGEDRHWTPAGHRIVADAIAAGLSQAGARSGLTPSTASAERQDLQGRAETRR